MPPRSRTRRSTNGTWENWEGLVQAPRTVAAWIDVHVRIAEGLERATDGALDCRQPIPVVDQWDDPEIPRNDNWRREFYLALTHQPEARAWLLDDRGFEELLQGGKPVYVLTRDFRVQELTSRHAVRLVARVGRYALLQSGAASPVRKLSFHGAPVYGEGSSIGGRQETTKEE